MPVAVLVFIAVITWGKAGLADGIVRYLLFGIFMFSLAQNRKMYMANIRRPVVLLVYSVILIIYIISFFNPSHRGISFEDLKETSFSKRIENSNNPEKSQFLANRFKSIMQLVEHSPDKSLAIFFDLKSAYRIKYKPNETDDLWNLLDEIEQKTKINNISFLPSLVTNNQNSFYDFIFWFLCLSIGSIIVYNSYFFSQERFFLHVISINSSLLAIIGILQKIYYIPSDNVLEILGVWDAPEPRYYFSTFTYKNHWSAFALLSIYIIASLLFKELLVWGKDCLRSKHFIFLILCLVPIIISIPFSGSRSGTILLLISFILITYIYLDSLTNYSLLKKIYFTSLIIWIPIFLFFSLLFFKSETSKEMISVTNLQFKAFENGKMPLRWHLWQDGIRIGFMKPILGHGFNSYSSINPKYQSHHVRNERSVGLEAAHVPYIPLVAHVHNDIIEWWCEWGLLGILLFLAPSLIFVLGGILGNFHPEVKFLLCGVLTIFIYSVVDFPTRTPACLALTSVCFWMGIKKARLG